MPVSSLMPIQRNHGFSNETLDDLLMRGELENRAKKKSPKNGAC